MIHLAGTKTGLIDYMSRNLVGLALLPSEYNEEFDVASIISLFFNLELIDNFILNTLANQNRAPDRLIKKRMEKKRKQKFNWNLNYTSNIPNIAQAVIRFRTKTITWPVSLKKSSDKITTKSELSTPEILSQILSQCRKSTSKSVNDETKRKSVGSTLA